MTKVLTHLSLILMAAFYFNSCCLQNKIEKYPPKESASIYPQNVADILNEKGLIYGKDYGIDCNGQAYKYELVVKFKSGILDTMKQFLRDKYKPSSSGINNCNCNVPNMPEIWENIPPSMIEGTKLTANKDSEIEGCELNLILIDDIDNNFDAIEVPNELNANIMGPHQTNSTTLASIAVIDTGIDPMQRNIFKGTTDTNLRLFANSCNSQYGYVSTRNNSYDIQDENSHGTAVSSVITQLMDNGPQNYEYQLLPIKATGKDGLSDLFTIICSFGYAFDKNVNVINYSAGWYTTPSVILGNLISDNAHSTIVVASAGNSSNDNSIKAHFPSDYKDVRSIGALETNTATSNLASFSNFGNTQHNAHGVGISAYTPYNNSKTVNGTSYAAPHVAAMYTYIYAHLITNGNPSPSPTQVQAEFDRITNNQTNIDFSNLSGL